MFLKLLTLKRGPNEHSLTRIHKEDQNKECERERDHQIIQEKDRKNTFRRK